MQKRTQLYPSPNGLIHYFNTAWPTPPSGRRGHRALEAKRLATGKKNAARLGAHLVFADQSGLFTLHTVVNDRPPGLWLWRNAGRGRSGVHRRRLQAARRWNLARRREHAALNQVRSGCFQRLETASISRITWEIRPHPSSDRPMESYPARQLQLTLRFIF